MEEHLQQDITQFFFDICIPADIAGRTGQPGDRVRQLRRLLQQIPDKALVALLAVPRTLATQAMHCLDSPCNARRGGGYE